MNRHLLKTFVVSLVSFVLLYYSVAWAVLRCSHEEDHGYHQVTLYNADAHARGSSFASPNHVQEHLDCMAPDYHTESLAGPSSASQLHRLTTDITSHVYDFLTLQRVAGNGATDLWLSAVFERVTPRNFLIDSSRYLSLSVLRI